MLVLSAKGGFDSGGCPFGDTKCEVMSYAVAAFALVLTSGGKLWGNFGGQRLSLKKTVGTELMVLIGKLSQESMIIMSPLSFTMFPLYEYLKGSEDRNI